MESSFTKAVCPTKVSPGPLFLMYQGRPGMPKDEILVRTLGNCQVVLLLQAAQAWGDNMHMSCNMCCSTMTVGVYKEMHGEL